MLLTFLEYFVLYRSPSGLVQDRASNPYIFSMASTGFGMNASSIQYRLGFISRQQAICQINQTLDTINRITPSRNRGWLYHFVNEDGKPAYDAEVSTIDTALFYLNAKQAARRINDASLIARVEHMIVSIDLCWMIENSPSQVRVCHGLHWHENDPKFITCEWDEYNEGILVYYLFGMDFIPTNVRYDLPLFVYYYPLCFCPHLETYLHQAIAYQYQTYGYVGITATDTESGYQTYPVGYVSPIALYSIGFDTCLPYTIHSYNRDTGWVCKDRIGIDEGVAMVLSTDYFCVHPCLVISDECNELGESHDSLILK